ncbi:GAF domain-containing protein [soil metagenome]
MDEPLDFCAPFMGSLPVAGVSVTIISLSGTPVNLGASDATAERIDQLQFELGDGPQWSAARSGELQLIEDVASGGLDPWPIFRAGLGQLAVGALFCVPMRMGAVTVGVVTLYGTSTTTLTPGQHATALAIASALAPAAVREALRSAEKQSDDSETPPALRREVHQATGILLVQLNTTATIAYVRLQAYAFANGLSVQSVARDVVAGVLSFEDFAP